jgi:MFS family permease
MNWLLQFCAARAAFATMFTAYSAVLPLVARDWGMTASQAGAVQSAYHVGFLVSLFAVGFLGDRYGARRTYLWGSVLATSSSVMFATLADGFASAALWYGITGLCSGASYTPGLAIVAQEPHGVGRGRALGFYLAAASLGYAVGLALSAAMIPLAGWRGAFLATACGPLIGALLGWRALRTVPNVVHPHPADQPRRMPLLEVMRNRPAMLSVWGYTWHAWELLGLWAWLPAFLGVALLASGSTGSVAGAGALLTSLTYLAAVFGSALGGTWSDRHGRTTVALVVSTASLACSLSFGWMLGLPMALIVVVAVIYNVTGVADSSIHSTTLTELTPPHLLGAAYSLRSVLGFGAGAIAPWVFGLVLDLVRAQGGGETSAWGLAWASLAAGGLLGPVATWWLRQSPEAAKLGGGRR